MLLTKPRDLNVSKKIINWNGTFKGNFLYQIELVTYLIAISWVLMSAFNLLLFKKRRKKKELYLVITGLENK